MNVTSAAAEAAAVVLTTDPPATPRCSGGPLFVYLFLFIIHCFLCLPLLGSFSFSPLCLSPPLDPSHSLHPQDVAVGWLENAWHRTGNPSPCQTPISAHAQADTFTQCTHTLAPPLSSFFRYVQALCVFPFSKGHQHLCHSFHFIPSLLFALQAHSSSFSFSSHSHLTLLLLIHIQTSPRESHTSFALMVILPRQIIYSTAECEQCTKEFLCPTHALACTGTLNAVRWSNQNTEALNVSSD